MKLLHNLLSPDFTFCDCVEILWLDLWLFPITHWILTDRVTADWVQLNWRSPAWAECAAIDQVIKETPHVWISESSSWRCIFIEFWSWVIYTSRLGSKGSSTARGFRGYVLTHLIITVRKQMSWLIVKRCICFWHFVLAWQSQQNVTSRNAAPA